MPRILTVDPAGGVSRLTRAALDVLEAAAVQVDVPGMEEALEELAETRFRLLIAPLSSGVRHDGVDFARRARAVQPELNILLIGDDGDAGFTPDAADADQYAYIGRPLDGPHFIRLIDLALDGQNILAASRANTEFITPEPGESGFIPAIDLKAAGRVISTLLNDVGAQGVLLSTRAGGVLLEQGSIGLDRAQLTAAVLPLMHVTHQTGHLIGGPGASLMVVDSGGYSVYAVSVGLHHFICLLFSAASGARAMGAVTRYGRRASEDLIALIGADALLMESASAASRGKSKKRTTSTLMAVSLEAESPALEPTAVRAESWEIPPAEPAPVPLLEPIEHLDVAIFQDDLSTVDASALDDLFDPERLAEIASENRRERGPLTYDEARELGLIP